MSLQSYLSVLRQASEYDRALTTLKKDTAPVWIEGLAGVSKSFVCAGLSRELQRVVLFVTASQDAAERASSDLLSYGLGAEEVGLYPATEVDVEDMVAADRVIVSSASPERQALARTRLAVLESLGDGKLKVVVAPIAAALRETIGPLTEFRVTLEQGGTVNLTELARRLTELGYDRVPLVEAPGQFAVRGGLMDVWPATHPDPVRLELFGDEIESIREFEVASQRSTERLAKVSFLPASEVLQPSATVSATYTLLEHLPAGSVVVLDEPNHLRGEWTDEQERLRRRQQSAQEAEKVTAELLKPTTTFIELDEFIRRVQGYRLVVLTLLAQSIPWLRKLLDQAEKVTITSGVVDAAHGNIPELANRLRTWMAAGNQVVIASDQPHRVVELLTAQELPATAEAGHARRPGEDKADDEADAPAPATDRSRQMPVVYAVHGRLSSGFRLPGVRLVILSDCELFGDGAQRRRPAASRHARKFQDARPIISLLELKEGDLVVHITHGIGRFRGLVQRTVGGIVREFLRIDYQDPDRLFVPSDQLDRVQKYIGNEGQNPNIHRLGSQDWARTKAKVRQRVREMAKELLELYASRTAAQGHPFDPDTIWQEEMEAAFPYRETRDQLRAINDVKRDMEAPRPMDRLVCGDVGYGKTEVAIRAAFKAVSDGKQVAVLVPTTVLAQQHYQTFTERLAAFPVKVALLSRFASKQGLKEAVQGIKDGTVDIAIGTHRILSKDVQFSDIGLLVVDEEQRFGVTHKERIKQFRKSVDVLTLTATPIPRTLNLSLSGIRDMSVIEEPPEGRLAVRTYCMEADESVLKDAILREIDRGGQIYFVHNRVESIYRQAEVLQRLVPQARIRVGHGQMKESELEDVMMSFYEGEFDILCCTTIIESGLDVPNANTILINNADALGLSQLHQLRGRVGRSSRQAYCYLLYKPFKELTETAEKRLTAIREFTDLGAGFNIAMRDLEIRGAGNLLGGEQSGQMVSVGFDLYCQMIEEAVKELKGEEVTEVLLPSVTLPLSALLPGDYIPTDGLRIAFYKKIAACRTHEMVDAVQTELEDRFGDPPAQVWNMLHIMRLRIDCIAGGVARIETDKETVVLWLARRVEKEEARELLRHNRRISVQQDRIIMYFDGENPLRAVQNQIKLLVKGGGKAAAAAVQRQLNAAETAAALTGKAS